MFRVLIGSIPAAIAMFVIGFLFFATPLMKLGSTSLPNAEAAAVQQSLATNLHKTGTYFVPDGGTPEQTVMYGQGPVATIHYNTSGYPVADAGAIVAGLVLDFIVALLIGAGLLTICARVQDFPSRARVVILFAVAAGAFMHLDDPIWYHSDIPYSLYLFVADVLALIAGGLVLARWFLPRPTMQKT